ncbi:MAG: ATP-binding protein [Muribaculaceae bacterium]|nr:ATP-binding protein [Muribaculaceae bacterium]
MKLHNFERFKFFDKEFNSGLNILVGDNEVGKSTILEAIHLALSGMYKGRYLKSDLSED